MRKESKLHQLARRYIVDIFLIIIQKVKVYGGPWLTDESIIPISTVPQQKTLFSYVRKLWKKKKS